MIVTLTPNPSLDRTLEVDGLERGAVTRVRTATVEPAGKGVNVSRALALHELKTRAVLPVGGADGDQLVRLLDGAGVDVATVGVRGSVRSNVALVEPDGTTTKLNEAGPTLSASEAEHLIDTLVDSVAAADWAVLCGSLPPGAPTDFYATAIARLACRVALDSSGPAFTLGCAASPELVKPNVAELAEATGLPIRSISDAVAAAEALRSAGAKAVLVSLGPDGALLVDADGVLHGEAPAVPVSTVGAGDALLAGFLAGGGVGAPALASALAWGAAAVGLPGSRMPGPEDLDPSGVRIHAEPDLARALHI